jgi:hypothetical protein
MFWILQHQKHPQRDESCGQQEILRLAALAPAAKAAQNTSNLFLFLAQNIRTFPLS